MSKDKSINPHRPQPGSITVGGDAGETDAAILACLAELKILTAANNDATALAMLVSQMEEICEKLLSSNTLSEQTNAELMALCQKMLDQITQDQANSDRDFACFEDIKNLLTCPPQSPLGVLTSWN